MKNPATVFMFSGQGSQYYQMGRELFRQQPTFRRLLLDMDVMARDMIGLSIVDELYNEARTVSEPFERTLLTHPAIFMVELALAQTLIERNLTPDYVLGASMGTFAAATIAGCIGLEQSFAALVKQARTLENHCQPGGMIAIFSSVELHQDDELLSQCEIAAINFSSHFVVAAKQDRLDSIEEYLKKKDVMFQRLPVSHAFHSRWIDEAEAPYQTFLKTLSFKPATIPIVCCTTANILTEIPAHYFWTIAREPIRFGETVNHLESRGTYRYIDAGPSGSLATFLKYALPKTSKSEVFPTLTLFGRDLRNLEALPAR